MTKRNTTKAIVTAQTEWALANGVDADQTIAALDEDGEGGDEEQELEGEPEPEEALPNSVVKNAYKTKYRERADAMARKPKGVPAKALRRMTGDWLAVELAKRTLDDKAKLKVADFEAILDANGIAHAHWNRTTKGWQGRLRMTGRLALQRVVAEDGELVLPDGDTIAAPRSWVAKHQH